MIDVENKIYELWKKITPFMLSVSKSQYGYGHTGGRLMMAKVLCCQDKYVDAWSFLSTLYIENKEISSYKPNKLQLIEFYEKLKSCYYFIERPIENFDDFFDRHKIINSDNDEAVDFNKITSVSAFDFDYLNTFVLDFNS
jgi:hypothetical protein